MFSRAGVHEESIATEELDSVWTELGSLQHNFDPLLERRVETIRNVVESYIAIVTKKFRDQIPKTITALVINRIRAFINGELLRALIIEGETVMKQSPEETERREKLFRTYNSVKEALKIIGEVNDETMKTLNSFVKNHSKKATAVNSKINLF